MDGIYTTITYSNMYAWMADSFYDINVGIYSDNFIISYMACDVENGHLIRNYLKFKEYGYGTTK